LAPVAAARALRITVETSLVVEDMDAAIAGVRSAAVGRGGRIAEGRASGNGTARSASFDLRVPPAELAAFRSDLARLGEVTSDAERAEDVTEQRADIDARVRNARAQEKRLLALLSDRTGSLAEVVAIEKELATIRETIERIEAQQRVLEGEIALATIKVQLTSRYAPASLGAGSRIAHAAREGIAAAGAFCVGLVTVLVMCGPTLAILALLGSAAFFAIRSMVRWHNGRKARFVRTA
jgi:hypothetical protein